MKPKLQKTFSPKPGDIDRGWWLADAAGIPLGRLASQVAQVLRGKHKPTFAPHVASGDHVIVINAEKVELTGKKETEKVYHHHSGFPGGLRTWSAGEIRARQPERLIESAVKGMLPKNRLGRRILRRLYVYAGEDHPHTAQDPEVLELHRRAVS